MSFVINKAATSKKKKKTTRDGPSRAKRDSGGVNTEPRRSESASGGENRERGADGNYNTGGGSTNQSEESSTSSGTATPRERSDDTTNSGAIAALPFYLAKIKDVSDIKVTANFIYNYYTADEGVSEVTSLSGLDADTDQYRFVVENIEKGTPPRSVKLTFISSVPGGGFFGESLPRGTIRNVIGEGKMLYEDVPLGKGYSAVGVYDSSVDQKIYSQFQSGDTGSFVDDSGFLSAAKQQSSGIKFSKSQTTQQTLKLYENEIKAKTLFSTHSKLFISDTIRSVERWQSSAYVDEYAAVFNYADSTQSSARTNAVASNPLQITAQEADIDMPIVLLSSIKTRSRGLISETFKKSTRVGIIIEKYGEQLDGTTLKYPDITLEGSDITTYTDNAVRYGGVYKYRVRTVYARNASADASDGSTIHGLIFIASTGNFATVQCVERDPPPPPNNISFQQTLAGLYIRWNFPLNPSKDIKRFQIFRRLSITDPFELIQEINFDQTVLPYTTGEDVPDELVTMSTGPIKHFVDTAFSRINSDFIYAICSIDAHGYTSNFSEQFRVRFDNINSKLRITRIATEGAPKPYPNATVLGDFFADLIKDSGRKRIRLYFDPEYTDVTSEGQSLNLIQTSGAGLVTHRLVLTELNLAQSQNVDIVVGSTRIPTTGIPPSIGRFYTSG